MERLQQVNNQVKSSLTIHDPRTNKTYEVKVHDGIEPFIKGADLEKIITPDSPVLRSYDPGFMNTISCTSKISFIDGDVGILEYRGYPIEQLAENCSHLEVAFLLIYGELPSKQELKIWNQKIRKHSLLHSDILGMMKSFRYDAHPMGMLIQTLSAMSTLHPEQNPSLSGEGIYKDQKMRNKQIQRVLGTITSIAAAAYRHRIGRNYNLSDSKQDYVENFLGMMDRLGEPDYKPHPGLVKALNVLFILHAEHELNCSTSAVRHLASSGVDVYSTIAGASAALYGPKHGGANEAVLRMLEKIGDKKNIPQFIENVKNKKELLFGFGHRVYKSYDPRAKIVKKTAEEVFQIVGKDPIIELAMELERIALSDEYFIKRQLYPNVDFYSGIIYKAMGFPTDMFVILFTIPRTAGWLAHWLEFQDDKENKIARPRQNYEGHQAREYVPIEKRTGAKNFFLEAKESSIHRRREISVQYMRGKN